MDQYGGSSWKSENAKSLSASHLDTVSFQEPGRVIPFTTQFPQYECTAGTGEIYLQSYSAFVLCVEFVHRSVPHCHLYRFPGCSNLSTTHSNRSWMQAYAVIGEVIGLKTFCLVRRGTASTAYENGNREPST